jgi:hypothetical protein
MRHDRLRSVKDSNSEEETEEAGQNLRQRQGETRGSQHFVRSQHFIRSLCPDSLSSYTFPVVVIASHASQKKVMSLTPAEK